MTERVPTPDEIAAMTPAEYHRLEDRVRQEAEKEGMRLDRSWSPEHRDAPYRLVETGATKLPRGFPWPWQTLAELVELMFGEHEPEFTHTGTMLHRNPKAKRRS
jgi:hypothetical protein